MADIWEHARAIAQELSRSLADMEVRLAAVTAGSQASGALDPDQLAAVIEDAWRTVVQEAKHEAGSPGAVPWARAVSVGHLADLHRRLASRAGAQGPGDFVDRSGPRTSWALFVKEMTEEYPPTEAWLLAELVWGHHVQSMGFALGWLCVNAVRLAQRQHAILPPMADLERLMKYLLYAGPDLYDAESLRALLGEYAGQQTPTASGSDGV